MQLHQQLSKNDAITVLEMIYACAFCDNEEKFRGVMNGLPSLFQHDYSVVAAAQFGDNGVMKSYDAINVSYPSEWIARYAAQNEHKLDPVFRAHCQDYRLQYFSDILARYSYPKKNRAVAIDFGIVDGYVHGFRNTSGTQGSMLCFAGRKVERDERTEAILELLTPHLHESYLRVINKKNGGCGRPKACLSPKEKEVLKWLKEGKGTWDISTLLAISERTVKFHISNIMQKLDASNRTHAMAIAVEEGLLDIE